MEKLLNNIVDDKIPYRLYIGEDKNVNWIDVKAVYSRKSLEPIFEDNSPIEEIWLLEDYPENKFGKVFLIKKEKSLWEYHHSFPVGRLILLSPQIKDEEFDKPQLIYKREK